jgi:hypothetical protein
LAIFIHRLESAPIFDQGVGEVVMDFRIVRLEPQRSTMGGDRFVELAGLGEGVAKIAVIISDIRIDGDGAADEHDAGVGLTGIGGDCAEEMKSIGMIRVLGENFAVDVFSDRQSAGAMMLHGDLDGLLN